MTISGVAVNADVIYNKKYDAYIRPDSYDFNTARCANNDYKLLSLDGEVVLDCGAHIGCFTRKALKVAKHVISVEPDPGNYSVLEINANRDIFGVYKSTSTLINRAVVNKEDSEDQCYLYTTADGFHSGIFSTVMKRGERPVIPVKSIVWEDLLEKYKPSVVKVDVEGAEYNWLDGTKLPKFVKQVSMEVHLNRKEWRIKKAVELVNSFKGWETLREPKIKGKHWATIATWRR